MTGANKIKPLNNPTLLDAAFNNVNAALLRKLGWLDNAFGKCEKLKEDDFIFPAIYTGENKEYLKLFPDEYLKNFSYFDTNQKEDIQWTKGIFSRMTADFGLVFWFDFRNVYSAGHYTLENIKKDILDVLATIPNIEINEVVDNESEIYSGYSYDQINNQHLMRPYGGLRFNGTVSYKASCS